MTKRTFFKSLSSLVAAVALAPEIARAVQRPKSFAFDKESWRQLCALLACSEARTITITHSELQEIARKAGQTERVFRIERKPRKYFR